MQFAEAMLSKASIFFPTKKCKNWCINWLKNPIFFIRIRKIKGSIMRMSAYILGDMNHRDFPAHSKAKVKLISLSVSFETLLYIALVLCHQIVEMNFFSEYISPFQQTINDYRCVCIYRLFSWGTDSLDLSISY